MSQKFHFVFIYPKHQVSSFERTLNLMFIAAQFTIGTLVKGSGTDDGERSCGPDIQ